MYRTTFASLRVPDIHDVDQVSGLIDLSTDIQYAAERNKSRLDELKRRRGVRVDGIYGFPVPNTTLTTIQWDSVIYDSDNYVDLSVSTTNIVVPRGVFLVTANVGILSTLTINTAYSVVSGSVYGMIASNQFGPAAIAAGAVLTLVGIFNSLSGEVVTMKCYQTSGAAATLYTSHVSLSKIGNL